MADPFSSEDLNADDSFETVTLDTLVGEGQKYKSPDELAKAYAHAERFIEQAKADKATTEARNKVLEDMLNARLENGKNSTPTNQDLTPRNEPPAEKTEENKVEKPDIEALVRNELANASEEKRKADNINKAAEALNRHYGSAAKAQEAIRNRASELGVKFEWLRDVASDSPQAFYASMGLDPNARSAGTPGYNPEVVVRGGAPVKGFKHFDEIRKTNPKLYNSREIQSQMFNARRELGDRFYTT